MRLLLLLPCLLLPLTALPAGAALTIDPTQSSLTPSSGPAETLSGTLQVVLGAPPLTAGSFDVVSLGAASSGGLSITLDPSLSNPGAGVIDASGQFLLPALFLQLDDGLSSFQLTVPSVSGTYGDLPGCAYDVCLETSFEIDTGGSAGIVAVSLYAIPEPAAGSLLLAGCAGLAWRARRAPRRVREGGQR